MAKLFFFVFMDRNEVKVHKNEKKRKGGRERGRERERDQYSTILIEPKVDRTEVYLFII